MMTNMILTTSTTNTNLTIISYSSSSISIPWTVSNSYVYSVSATSIIYLNSMISDYDNTNLTTALLGNYSIAAKLSIIRLA